MHRLKYYILYHLCFGKTRAKYKQKYKDICNKQVNYLLDVIDSKLNEANEKNQTNYSALASQYENLCSNVNNLYSLSCKQNDERFRALSEKNNRLASDIEAFKEQVNSSIDTKYDELAAKVDAASSAADCAVNNVNLAVDTVKNKVDSIFLDLCDVKNTLGQEINNLNDLKALVASDINTKIDAIASNNSFSQFGEDLILGMAKEILLNKQILSKDDITYLDIGANWPKTINNTYRLYREGYNGILVEPNRILADRLRRERPYDTVLEVGVTNVQEDSVQDFYQFEEWANGWSTFSKNFAEEAVNKSPRPAKYEVIPTKVCNINSVMDAYLKTTTPFLVDIDVEGVDFDILSGINLDKYRPVFFVIETADLSSGTFLGRKISNCAEYLKQHDYVIYADTYVNTIFIDKSILEKMY